MARNESAGGLLVAPSRDLARYRPTVRGPTGIRRGLERYWLDVVLVAPLMLYVLFFMLVPVAQSIYLSFVHAGTNGFTLANYQDIINRSQFRDAFVNTIGITVIGVAMEMTSASSSP